MSYSTRTCPSHPAPAPIPMVGMVRLSEIRRASPAGTSSSTKPKAPASSSTRASFSIAAAAEGSRPCTR